MKIHSINKITCLSCRCTSLIRRFFSITLQIGSIERVCDGIGQTFLVEVKTQAIDCSAPLSSVTDSQILQSNLEMVCTGGHVTFRVSYHPEQNCANTFFIERDNLLLGVCKTAFC